MQGFLKHGPLTTAVMEEQLKVRIAIPRFGESVAPCFGQTSTITIFTVHRKRIVSQEDFAFNSRDSLDRIRLLRDQEVDVLICGGMQDVYETLLSARGIRVYSWVSGNAEDLIDRFLHGTLVPGGARIGRTPAAEEHPPEETPRTAEKPGSC